MPICPESILPCLESIRIWSGRAPEVPATSRRRETLRAVQPRQFLQEVARNGIEAIELVRNDDVPTSQEQDLSTRYTHPSQSENYLKDNSGLFSYARNFVMHNPVMVNASTNDHFMTVFAAHTLRGAELDSSARFPPPRCHPQTRLAIIERVRSRLKTPTKRVQWLVGPAGVGKSAIMQTIAELEKKESAILAALFFSAPNGRNDPAKVIFTLAYQIALQHEKYCQYIRSQAKADPKLWEKSTDVQFNKFIVEPFAILRVHRDSEPILIFIDGLDECKGQQDQIQLLSTIHAFVATHPRAPLLWVISSRPEAHITTHMNPLAFYSKEEVSVDSPEACQDVERFLRTEFNKIRDSDPVIQSLHHQWPPESQLLKLLAAALGLFAYADTVVRFVGDLVAGDPISRFELILDLIDNVSEPQSSALVTRGVQPMANLDALYQYLMSQVPPQNIPHLTEILAFVVFFPDVWGEMAKVSLVVMCNWLGMSANVTYGALRQLHSVLYVPLPQDAHDNHQHIRVYHKSFSDFILDPERSGINIGTAEEEEHRHALRSARILGQIPYQPKKLPDSAISLSWPSPMARGALYIYASAFFKNMSSLPSLPISQVAHALQVIHLSRPPFLSFVHELTFGEIHPEFTRLFRADGTLQDFPISLIDLEELRSHKLPIAASYDGAPMIAHHDWKESNNDPTRSYNSYESALVSLLALTQKNKPDHLVRGYFGVEMKAVIHFRPITPSVGQSSGPKFYMFMYNFSTIYAKLQDRRSHISAPTH
ncbi:hypothetical protein NP233_g3270 [Leucocoprinus birnbaumii]|uniref:Nephrocystin 3-like N-terminal domain-containing protein n=1 Tax=Leucocoprinus birnbaumii TaxID=56174 RepID=A0AAD5VWS3_9AGAR|nr:hypothetical protein NP233_g3270 [Leucocoprinus birnbaumii]